jgi:hypothetical protein
MVDPKPETEPKKGETSEQFKERIEEAQRELARQNAAKPASQPALNDPSKSQEQVTTSAPVAQPQGTPPATATSGVIPEVDEWWSKKGFKSSEDIANSYRELERELTRKNQELARANQPPQVQPQAPVPMAPPAGYPPYIPQWASIPPPGQPPQYIAPPPQASVEQLAEQYGLAPDDFKKVYAIANDLSQVNVQRELNRVMPGIINQVRGINADVTRQREMVDLMSEPTFKNPQVQFEMHKVLNEDPTIIQRQTLPYRYAHDEALKRIARVNLGGSTPFQSPQPNGPASSGSTPPRTAGANGKASPQAAGGIESGEMTADQFAALPYKEKQEFLRAVGARPG